MIRAPSALLSSLGPALWPPALIQFRAGSGPPAAVTHWDGPFAVPLGRPAGLPAGAFMSSMSAMPARVLSPVHQSEGHLPDAQSPCDSAAGWRGRAGGR